MSNLSDTLYNYVIDPGGLNMNEALAQISITLITIVVWIIVGVLASRIIKVLIFKSMKVNKNEARALTVAKLLNSIAKYVIWFIVALMILGALNVNVTPFIASAGVVGLAIGFGAQEIVKDFISGFFIIFEGSFNVGEIVEIDGFKGTVLSLGLRTTILENWLGEQKIITNGNISSMINYSRNDTIAIIDFGVGYDTDLNKLNLYMLEFAKVIEAKYEVITEIPQFLGVMELADSSINLRMIVKTETMKHFQVERDVRKDLVEMLLKNSIEIPFPQVVVHNA
jgi:small conductance mechanosensitive channel